MYTFTELKKNCRKDASALPVLKFALLGDCATQHLATAIHGYAYAEGYNLSIFDADYDQIGAQVMDSSSELYAFEPVAVLICMCTEKLYECYCAIPPERRSHFADEIIERIRGYWDMIGARIPASILQCTFPELDDRTYGNYGAKTPDSFLFQQRLLNCRLMSLAAECKNVFLVDLASIQNRFGRERTHDDKLYYIAKMPFHMDILPEIAKQVLDVIHALKGRSRKCAVLDLDNTLWGGVIGDDGLDGIQIGELGLGHAFSDFQTWLKELKNRGVILAVCSKNNEETAKEPFLSHPEMVLRLEDIALFVANWEDKATNLRAIQQTLNIGFDSMVFFDDNPFERNLVQSMFSEITVPALPEDPAEYLSYARSLNLFETASASEEDRNRTSQYQQEIGRAQLQCQYASYDDYLLDLRMEAAVMPFDAFHYPRIAQLTQRSNQFNLRTVRCTEADIEAIAGDPAHLTLYFTLRDKFGDHGLISVVIMDRREGDTLFISQWLMSCRVLKRGMEEFIVNAIVDTAKANGFKKVVGEYIRTPKNSMVEHIYEKLGFRAFGNGRFEADIEEFIHNKTFINA